MTVIKSYKKLFACLLFLITSLGIRSANLPSIGAQVYIEPWHTPEQVDSFFRILQEHRMTTCRLHMFEGYMHKPDGSWNFSLFDQAFEAARKHQVKIFATLAPLTGGSPFAYDESYQKSINTYIEKVVSHFKAHPALQAWVVYNEIGFGDVVPQTPLIDRQYENWKSEQAAQKNKPYSKTESFIRKHFQLDLNTWYLNYLVNEVKKQDPDSHVHVNTHQIFKLIAEYDFPAWRNAFTSLGLSAHPSWHYGYFAREDYTLALSANCDITRSGAGHLPFWVTELQGGNNIYSGIYPFCPTKEEITQWLWTAIGTGADGSIFWCLNARAKGKEAGEWALLNFQDKPTERLKAAGEVAACVANNGKLFEESKVIETPIHILYVRESLWTEEFVQYKGDNQYEGRQPGGVIKSALAFYQVLLENGVKSNLSEIHEFDWDQKDYAGDCILLANQVAIPSRYWNKLEQFVANGGKLIAEGLTAFYDENMQCLPTTGFPLNRLFGGTISEVTCTPGDFDISIGNSRLPAHLWESYICNETGEVIAKEGDNAIAIRHPYGKGEVVWVPSLIGLGAWRTKNKKPLSDFLISELQEQIARLPICFTSFQDGITMQTLQTGNAYLTILINKGKTRQRVQFKGEKRIPELLFTSKNGNLQDKTVHIDPEETIVMKWKKVP